MEGTLLPAPRRSPSLIEDLGTVGAVSMPNDPVPWVFGVALLVSTAWWAPASIAVGWYGVALLLAVPVPLLPRALLRGAGAAAVVVVAGVAIGVLNGAYRSRVVPLEILLGIGQATALPWAAAVGRARHARATADDGEAASARVAIWVQEHPWGVATAVLALVGPGGALWMQAWIAMDDAHPGNPPLHLMLPQWMTPGALLLVAAPFGRRILRAAELGIVGFAVAALVWGAVVWLAEATSNASFRDEILRFLLSLGGASVALLVAAAWAARIPFGWTSRRGRVVAAVAAWLLAEALLAAACATKNGRNAPPEDLKDWAVVVGRHGVLLALLVVAATSTLRGRTILALLVVYGAAVTLCTGFLADESAWALHCAPVSALGCLNQALFALAVRRIRSLTVVPAAHALRADWAVDRRTEAGQFFVPRKS
jgi:hypothetical protein